MVFTPRRPTNGAQLCWRSFVFRYSLFASTCVIFLFLGAMYCINSCNLSVCDERQCEAMRMRISYFKSDGHRESSVADNSQPRSGGWIGSLFGGTVALTANKPKLSAFLVVLILTSSQNMERRVTIRQTWLKDVRSDVLHLFSIGVGVLDEDEKRTLKSEIERFQDILFLQDVNDTYNSLTKKLLTSIVWIDRNVDFEFLFKVDDDSFARIDEIAAELQSLSDKTRLHWGFFNGHAQVFRKGQWAEKDWILCDHYLPYALGGGYVLSVDMVRYIAANKNYLKLYKSEDVSVGAWLAPVDVRRVHDPRFDTEYQSRGCFNSYLVTHKQSVDQMREKYWLLQERGKLCASEQRTRLSYDYNWNVPPSQCCIRNDSKIP